MSELAQRIDLLRESIGETVFDPDAWPRVMQGICTAARSIGAGLFQNGEQIADIPCTEGVRNLFDRYLAESWHQRDIRIARGFPLLSQGHPVVTDHVIMRPDEIDTDPAYIELLAPLGLKWFAGVGFRVNDALWGFSIQRTSREGPFSDDDIRLLGSLRSKLTEAATLSKMVGLVALSSSVDALQSVTVPAVAINRNGTVLATNALANTLFDRHLGIRFGRLFIAHARARRSYEGLLEKLRHSPETEYLGGPPILVARDGDTIRLRALSVPATAKGPFLGARAILAIEPLPRSSCTDIPSLKQIFDLTPAETRLCSLLVEGTSLEEAADRLGLAKDTLRTQLKGVFRKTNTARQGELIALLARYA